MLACAAGDVGDAKIGFRPKGRGTKIVADIVSSDLPVPLFIQEPVSFDG